MCTLYVAVKSTYTYAESLRSVSRAPGDRVVRQLHISIIQSNTHVLRYTQHRTYTRRKLDFFFIFHCGNHINNTILYNIIIYDIFR